MTGPVAFEARADCTASFSVQVGPNGMITETATGSGSCPTTGIGIKIRQGDTGGYDGFGGCSTSPCTVVKQQGISCLTPGTQTWSVEVSCSKLSPGSTNGSCEPDAAGYASTSVSVPHHPDLWVDWAQSYNMGGRAMGAIGYNIPAASNKNVYIVGLPRKTSSAAGTVAVANLGTGPARGSLSFNIETLPGSDTYVAIADSCGDEHKTVPLIFGGSCPIDGSSSPGQPPGTTCHDCVGHPVRLGTGNMRFTDIDPLPSAQGLPMRRVYDSAGVGGSFGSGWSSLFDGWLRRYQDFAVIGTETDERFVFENYLNQGTFIQIHPQTVTPSTLSFDGSNYTLRSPSDDLIRVFRGSDGRLVSYQSRSTGRVTTVSFDAYGPTHVDDSWGRFGWTIGRSGQSTLIDTITVDGTSLVWQYTYEAGNLTAVNAPGPATWRSYNYSGTALTEVRDAAGNLLESHTYNQSNYANTLNPATNSIGPGGDISNIQYDINGRDSNEKITRVTMASGAVTDYYDRVIMGMRHTVEVHGSGCSACGSNDAVYAYEKVTGDFGGYSTYTGNIVREQNARGYVTVRTFTSGGRATSIVTAYKPVGCDPETDSNHCRQTPDGLLTVSLEPTAVSSTTMYQYDDANWPNNPTLITTSSVRSSGHTRRETLTYDPATGATLSRVVDGYSGVPEQEQILTTTVALYGTGEAAAFTPGGAFDSAWLTLPQPAGFRKSSDGPRSDVPDLTQWVYYPFDASVPNAWRGQLAASRNALGQITRFENYDLFGNAMRVVDPNGVASESAYDSLGRLLTSTLKGVSGCDTTADPLCATDITTSRSFQPTAGPLASDTRANGSVTSYGYDSRARMVSTTRPVNGTNSEKIDYSYDNASGNRSSERYSSGVNNVWTIVRSDSYLYDTIGRLSETDHPDATKIVYTYDAANNLATVKDENHTAANTTYAYDPLNRLSRVTQVLASAPGGTITTQYGYDTNGNLTSVTDPNGNVTTYLYDDFGRMLQQTSPVTGTTLYAYDDAGNLTSTTDANGAATTRTYDALNRLLTAVSSNGSSETVSYAYDNATSGWFGMGRLSSMTDPTGSAVYRYGRRGELVSEVKTIQGTAYTTTYRYAVDGNRSSITYPSGRVVSFGFDQADRVVSAVAGTTTLASAATYLPFGPLTSLTYGNGTAKTMRYDTRYRVLENKLTGPSGTLIDHNYAEDAAGNITQIHDALDATWNRDFGYDDLSRLTTANSGTSLWGTGAYAYDSMGNLLTLSLGTARASSFSYQGSTPMISTATENGTPRSVSYDAAGNEQQVGSGTFGYSPRNKLTSGDGVAYGYDGRGVRTITAGPGGIAMLRNVKPQTPEQLSLTRRVIRWIFPPKPSISMGLGMHLLGMTAGERRYSLYTPELSLMAETATSTAPGPAIAWEYVWFNGQPLAQIENATGAVRTYFDDHLGTPIAQTDDTGAIVWRAEHEPYGSLFTARTGGTLHQPLRFPGQEFDDSATSEREYNIFRWYRAGWGRYTQADPLGLRGALNVLGYANESPANLSDALGLKARVCCRRLAPPADTFRHCFVQVNDNETWALHTKPATTAHFIRSFFDPSTTATVEHNDNFDSGTNPGDSCGPWSNCGNVDDCVRQTSHNYPSPVYYDPAGSNSNTFAKTVADTCHLKAPPVVDDRKYGRQNPVPGWDHASPPMRHGASGGW